MIDLFFSKKRHESCSLIKLMNVGTSHSNELDSEVKRKKFERGVTNPNSSWGQCAAITKDSVFVDSNVAEVTKLLYLVAWNKCVENGKRN